MHPLVASQIFDEEVGRLAANAVLLADRGWWIVQKAFPTLRVAILHRATSKIRLFEFSFDDWNDQPPSLRLLDAETLQELAGNLWPTNGSYWHHGGWSGTVGRPGAAFMCMPGILEYHNHSSHTGDLWTNYKNLDDFTLGGIVAQVAEVYQKSHV